MAKNKLTLWQKLGKLMLEGKSNAAIGRSLTRRKGFKGPEVKGTKDLIINQNSGHVILKQGRKYHAIDMTTGQEESENYLGSKSKVIRAGGDI